MTIPLIPCQSPSTRVEAEVAFRAYAARTRIACPEGDLLISETNEGRILSLWGAACDALRVGPNDDVVPVLADLWNLKAGMNEAQGLARSVPDDAAGCAKRIMRTVYGYTGSARRITHAGGSLMPAAWRPLLAFAGERDTQPRAHLAVLARVSCWAAPKLNAPRELPTAKELHAVAGRLPRPVKKGSLICAIACYRRLRAAALAADPENAERFAALPDTRRTQGRGLLKVLVQSKDLVDRALGEAGDLRAAIKAKAPLLYKQLLEFEADPRGLKGRILSVGYAESMWVVAGHIVAILCLHRPEFLADFELDQLWTQTITLRADTAGVSERNRKYLEATSEDGAGSVAVLLARWLADRMAVESRRLTGASGGYAASLLRDTTQWWTLTEYYHGNDLRTINPALWREWERAYESLQTHMRANPVPEDEMVKKASLARMELVSMPHLWCVGLPVLGREAERHLDRLEAMRRAAIAAGRPDPLKVESVLEAREAFARSSEPYLVTVLVWIDTMRRAQYWHGRWGLHFVTDYSESGRLIALHCNWAGKRLDLARVKQGSTGRRAYGPGLINLRVLAGYVEHVRAPRLIRLGASPDDATAPNGKWPLFVSPDAQSLDRCAYSESTLRKDRLGVTLYRVATEILGHVLEPYETLDRARTWKGAFSMHEARKDVATIIGELLSMWERACQMTMDTVDTLKKRYVVAGFHPVGEPGEWRCIETYYPYLHALLEDPRRAPCPLDDPDLPLPPGARAMLERWAEEDAAHGRKGRRSKHGVADARMRRPRPDVAPKP